MYKNGKMKMAYTHDDHIRLEKLGYGHRSGHRSRTRRSRTRRSRSKRKSTPVIAGLAGASLLLIPAVYYGRRGWKYLDENVINREYYNQQIGERNRQRSINLMQNSNSGWIDNNPDSFEDFIERPRPKWYTRWFNRG